MVDKIGMVGLGAMGKSLALNIQNNGYEVVGFDVDEDARERAEELGIPTAESNEDLAESFDDRKAIWLMVPPSIVDNVLEELEPHLDEGDIIIEGGNSFYKDTEERVEWAEKNGLLFIGTGVSGGEEGALQGPSLMPGGHEESYEELEEILEDIAAKAYGEPCVTYLGEGGAGHFVKMVHNGIEYAIMEAIVEAYHIMLHAGVSYERMHEVFSEWADSEHLGGYLMEISADILGTKDSKTGKPKLEVILDEASQKGTGRWTSQTSMDMGVPITTITDAVSERIVSSFKEIREEASQTYESPPGKFEGDEEELLEDLEDALYFSIIAAYAQGFFMLGNCNQADDEVCNYDLNLKEIAKIWRGGCIIRSELLNPIMEVYEENSFNKHLLLSDSFSREVKRAEEGLRKVTGLAHTNGVPIPIMGQTLSYFDSLRHGRLPSAAMIQAMRDYFGSHTYRRVDEEGDFHTLWTEDDKKEIRKEDTTEYYQRRMKNG